MDKTIAVYVIMEHNNFDGTILADLYLAAFIGVDGQQALTYTSFAEFKNGVLGYQKI